MKTLMAGLIVAAIAVAVLSFAKDIIVKTSFEKGVEALTGLPLKTGDFRVSLVRQIVGMRRCVLYNPRGYKDRIMLDAPEIYIDYDLPAAMKGKIRFDDLRIDLKEFLVVKNENGELNINSLRGVGAREEEEKKPAKKSKAKELEIGNLELRIGKVIYKDYSKGAPPLVKEFDAGIDERYTNIKNPSSVIRLIVVKALVKTTIANLANFDLGALKDTVIGTLGTAQGAAESVSALAKETLQGTKETLQGTKETLQGTKETLQGTKETLQGTKETLQKTTEDLKNALKLPFNAKSE